MEVDIKGLQVVFQKVFGKEAAIDINTERKDLLEWDSINQYNLIIEIEDFYDISLSRKEIERLNSVKSIIEVLDKKK